MISTRLVIYGAASTGLAAAVVASAFKSRPNFFSAAVAIGRSSGALMVLANYALFVIICIGIALKTVFFGRLRAIEYEHLFERLWLFLTESLLALTIFRDDFNAPFAFMYALLVFLKCFHWITADRVDYMDQIPPPGPPFTFHLRVSSIISLLILADLLLVTHSLETILVDGVSAMVLFGSEFMILLASVTGTFARYIIGLVDLRRAGGREDAPSWEQKSMYLFYVDLAVDFMKLLTYLSFFTVIFLHYGLPLHILRDVYMTLRSFLSRCSDLVRYRRATRDMDALYPNATQEELERSGDRTCIICREEMVAAGAQRQGGAGEGGPNETPKKLACGHVFHFHCLRSWLERQQSCPTCRRDVLRNPATNSRPARPGAAPAPAPGAVPRPNGLAPAPAAGPDNRAAFNEFFRLPAENGAVPGPLQPPSVQTGVAPPPTQPPQEPEDAQIQRSIWGGPIIPGRFHPAPLGAAPRSSAFMAPPGLPRLLSQPQAPRPHLPEAGPSTSTRPGPTALSPSSPDVGASGSTTPFSSNPPAVFTSLGSSKPGSSADTESAVVDENLARKQAADAALRRFGLLPTSSISQRGFRSDPSPANDSGPTAIKGKGKATEAIVEELAPPPPRHFTPFLTPAWVSHSTDVPKPWSSARLASGSNARSALDDRLRVLREVDEVVSGLIGELTRVRSQWESDDDEIIRQSTSSTTPIPPDPLHADPKPDVVDGEAEEAGA